MSRKSRKHQRRGMYLSAEMGEVQRVLRECGAKGGAQKGSGALQIVHPAIPAAPPVDPAIIAMLQAQSMGVCLSPVDVRATEKPVTYVIGGGGLFCVRKTSVGEVVQRLAECKLPQFAPVATGWYANLPYLPWAVMLRVVAFLRAIRAKQQTEALIRVFFNRQTEAWGLWVPPQEVTVAAVLVADTVQNPPELGEWVGEIHSHPGNSSVFSMTDDEHEKGQLIYGCVASLAAGEIPNFHFRIGTGYGWFDLELENVVEAPEPQNVLINPLALLKALFKLDPFTAADVPAEWIANVREKKGGGGHYNGYREGYQAGTGYTVNDRRVWDRDDVGGAVEGQSLLLVNQKPIVMGDQQADDTIKRMGKKAGERHFEDCSRTMSECALCRAVGRADMAEEAAKAARKGN